MNGLIDKKVRVEGCVDKKTTVKGDALLLFEEHEVAGCDFGARFGGAKGFRPILDAIEEEEFPEDRWVEVEDDFESEQYEDNGVTWREKYEYDKEEQVTLASAPEVWGIACEKEAEASAVFSLYQKYMGSDVDSPFLSAFAIPQITGFVFVEASWDQIPSEVVAQLFEMEDIASATMGGPIHILKFDGSRAFSIIEMCLYPKQVRPGKWCRLRFQEREGKRRLYDNEVALVVESNHRHAVVITVPLLPRTAFKKANPQSALDIEFARRLYDKNEFTKEYHEQTIKTNSFENGLWVFKVPLINIQLIEGGTLTQLEFFHFAASKHEAVKKSFPRITDWVYEKGDKVAFWWDRRIYGIVHGVLEDGLFVIDADGMEHEWGWAAIKMWSNGMDVVGDDGYAGAITNIQDESIEVWDMETRDPNFKNEIRHYYHANKLRRRHGSSSHENVTNTGVGARRVCPWKDVPVRVIRGAYKGDHIFVDLIAGASTKSTYKVVLCGTVLNNQTWHSVDYNHVVDDRTGLPLHKTDSSKIWEMKFPMDYQHPCETRPSKRRPGKTPFRQPRTHQPVASTSITRIEPDARRKTPPPTLDRHPSQRWLWELDTFGLRFTTKVKLDDQLINATLWVERVDEAFATRQIWYHRHRKDHQLYYTSQVIPVQPSIKANRPYFVMSGEHKGKTLARLKGEQGQLRSIEVDVALAKIKEGHLLASVLLSDCCLLEMEKEKWDTLNAQLIPLQDEL